MSNAERLELGRLIKSFRLRAGMSGAKLAKASKIAQARVSRIETGLVKPTAEDISSFSKALGLSSLESKKLLRIKDLFAIDFDRWSLGDDDVLEQAQRICGELEADAQYVRSVVIGVIPGLLQTEAYMRNIFWNSPSGTPEQKSSAIKLRLERQASFFNGRRTYELVLFEHALKTRICSARDGIEQLEKIEQLVRDGAINLWVVPHSSKIRRVPAASFKILDDSLVTVEAPSRTAYFYSQKEVDYYVQLFNSLREDAVTGGRVAIILEETKAWLQKLD